MYHIVSVSLRCNGVSNLFHLITSNFLIKIVFWSAATFILDLQPLFLYIDTMVSMQSLLYHDQVQVHTVGVASLSQTASGTQFSSLLSKRYLYTGFGVVKIT